MIVLKKKNCNIVMVSMLLAVLFAGIAQGEECETGSAKSLSESTFITDGASEYPTKEVDNAGRLAMAESASTAHLKNNVLDLYFSEQNSDLWLYQWQPGQWGESCYHEHFGVYTDDAGRTLESEEFTIDQPFTDPGGVPGTITAILHYGDVQVKRKITLSSGDIRFFEIEYTIKNAGSSTLSDVRFFQTIDFDIPWTGDHTDDYAWYDPEHDYVVVNDEEYFKNSFTGSIPSDRHGMDHWSTEIYDDWDDGNLNNANNYGPGDPAIGLQYNFGNLAAGSEKVVTITVWSGEPTEEMEPKFNSITFGDNKGEHHTEDYPDEYNNDQCNVLRRGQSFDLNADIENFDDDDHKIIFMIVKPEFICQMITARKDGTLGSGWDCVYTRKWYNQNKFDFKIHIPGDDQVGKYQLIGMIQKKDGTETYDSYGDDEDIPEFFVIFNPWSSEDVDVSYPQEHELDFFATGDDGRQYYPKSYDTSSWTLEPANKKIFETAIETVSGDMSGFDSANKIMDKISYNAGHDGNHPWDLGYEFDESKGAYGYYELGKDDPFDSSEILGGAWWNVSDFGGHPDMTSSSNVPNIINTWLNNPGNNPYGQCMQFGGLGTSLLRSIGIPSKMVSIPDGKKAHKPSEDWWPTFHIWSEAWINNEWKEIATTYQDPNGPSSKCDALYQTEIRSNYEVDGSPDTDGFVDHVFTDQVVSHWWLWWKLDRVDILDEYKECTESTSMSRLNVNALGGQVELDVTTAKTQYALGEDVILNITVRNDGDVSINNNLTTEVIEYLGDGMTRYVWRDMQLISVPAHTTYSKIYTLSKSNYKYDGQYYVFSNIDNIANSTQFNITGGLNLTVILPETVLIHETFDVTLETKNTLGIPITNIEIRADFPYYADVTGPPINFTIPTLAPGATNTTTWVVSMPDDGYQSMVFTAQSERGDYEQISTGTEVMSNPFLRVDVEVPSSVQKDSTFAVNVTIENEGDLSADNVQSELSLPPELTTSDDLIRYIGTIDPHANTTIVWNITANKAGTSAFTIVTNSSTTSGEDVIFIPIFIYDHDLELSVEQSQIEADGELYIINMTIHNLGDVDDSVLLQYLVTNSDISFSIYDGDERIIAQPVTVPANGDKILNLKIIPEYDATGAIMIHSTSELDPTAADSTNIIVSSPIETTPPVATDDSATTLEDIAVDINVIANDYDVDGNLDPTTANTDCTTCSGPAHGTLTNHNNGTFMYTLDPDYNGPDSFIYEICDTEGLCDTAIVNIDVTAVNDVPVVSVDVTEQTVQYSDGIADVTISASDVDSSSLAISTSWRKDDGEVQPDLPPALVLSAGEVILNSLPPTWVWILEGQAQVDAGTYGITFRISDGEDEIEAHTTLVVKPEDAVVVFDETNPVAVQVAEPGGNNELISLTMDMTETIPDIALLEYPGDISLAEVSMNLVPVGPGSTVEPTSCSLEMFGSGYDSILTVTCAFNDVPVNTYTVQVTVDGGYYTSSGEDVVVIYDPSLGFTTGGGTFLWPDTGEKTNFGYTMKYNKKATNIQGNLLLVRHLQDGTIYRVKSNALYGLALGESEDGGETFGWASFSGKSTYLEPGWDEPIGNHEFITYVEDHGEPGKNIDRIWIKVIDVMSMDDPGADNAVVINGGNIVVPHN